MSASRQGIQKCREWLALLAEQGWSGKDKEFLLDYWWEHHDDDGKIYPPGIKRSPAAHDGPKEK